MQSRTVLQAALFIALVVALGWLVAWSVDGWADWVVLGVVVVTAVGGAIAIYPRRYPTKKRTFVRHSDQTRR